MHPIKNDNDNYKEIVIFDDVKFIKNSPLNNSIDREVEIDKTYNIHKKHNDFALITDLAYSDEGMRYKKSIYNAKMLCSEIFDKKMTEEMFNPITDIQHENDTNNFNKIIKLPSNYEVNSDNT